MAANRKERSAMTKRWADKNRERVRAYNKEYSATPEAKAKRAERRAKNKESIQNRAAAYYQENKDHMNAVAQVYRENNKEKTASRGAAWQQANKNHRSEYGKIRANHNRANKYKLTIEELSFLYEKYQGCCAICRVSEEDLGKRLAIDHCHETGLVRGILCQRCNLGIGQLGDTQELLVLAVEYLRNHEGQS